MKTARITVALAASAAALSLAGCQSTGQSTPAVSADITTAYNNLCAAVPALGPISAKLNAQLQADYTTAVAICAAGAPTNAVVAGIDIVAIYSALLQYIPTGTKVGS